MEFRNLIGTLAWDEVWSAYMRLYPEHCSRPEKYRQIWDELQVMEPIDSDCQIVLEEILAEDDDPGYTDVSGMVNGEIVGLDFTPWAEWLSMEIAPGTEHDYTPAEIVAHCLWEMTFYGNEHETQEKARELARLVDRVRAGEDTSWLDDNIV